MCNIQCVRDDLDCIHFEQEVKTTSKPFLARHFQLRDRSSQDTGMLHRRICTAHFTLHKPCPVHRLDYNSIYNCRRLRLDCIHSDAIHMFTEMKFHKYGKSCPSLMASNAWQPTTDTIAWKQAKQMETIVVFDFWTIPSNNESRAKS